MGRCPNSDATLGIARQCRDHTARDGRVLRECLSFTPPSLSIASWRADASSMTVLLAAGVAFTAATSSLSRNSQSSLSKSGRPTDRSAHPPVGITDEVVESHGIGGRVGGNTAPVLDRQLPPPMSQRPDAFLGHRRRHEPDRRFANPPAVATLGDAGLGRGVAGYQRNGIWSEPRMSDTFRSVPSPVSDEATGHPHLPTRICDIFDTMLVAHEPGIRSTGTAAERFIGVDPRSFHPEGEQDQRRGRPHGRRRGQGRHSRRQVRCLAHRERICGYCKDSPTCRHREGP